MALILASHPKVKLRVDDFDLLAENGGLAGLVRSELLDGDIYALNAQYPPHAFTKMIFQEALIDWARQHAPHLRVMAEASVAMPPNDEPMPDLILTSEPRGRRGIPVESVALLVEIADESRRLDLGYKAELYARQGVPEYWVVDLKEAVVVRHARPADEGYGERDPIPFGQPVEAVTLAGLSVATGDLLD